MKKENSQTKKSTNWKNVYGFKVSDVLGSFSRWFSDATDGDDVMSNTLREIMLRQAPQDFKDAYEYCEWVARQNGFEFKELTEADFKKTGNPIKKLFNKIFKK
jgi:hypothetical protein